MLSMKEKALLGVIVIFVAVVAASVVIPVKTFEVKLVTNPSGGAIFVPAGERFLITCDGVGDDGKRFSSMKWLNKEKKVIPEGIPGVQKEGANSAKLIFNNPKIEESGVYKCAALYDNKHALEKEVKITFHGLRPTFDDYFENITAEEGSPLLINCSALGDKPMTFEWYQYEDKISEENNSAPMFILNSENGSTLVIREFSRSHEGMYTCLAKNDHGLSSKVYQLRVRSSSDNETDEDASILKIDVTNITSNSVRFLIDVSGPVKSIEARYEEDRDKTVRTMKWKYGENYKVRGLLPSGRYKFIFRAIPSENWSKSYTVILLPAIPELIFQDIAEGTVKLKWFVKVDDIGRGTIDSYELRYATVQMQGGNIWLPSECPVIIQIPKCTGSSYTIAGLSRKVYYEIQLRAHTVSGYGDPYKQKIFLS